MSAYKTRKGFVLSITILNTLEQAGLSESAIAAKCGLSRMGLYKIRKRMGWQQLERSDKGGLRKFESIEDRNEANRLNNSKSQRNYYAKHGQQYIQVMVKGRRTFEHRLIMEQHLWRELTPEEVVHHINHNPQDNRIGNLMLFASQKEHRKYECKEIERR